jgi:hypothetical protein
MFRKLIPGLSTTSSPGIYYGKISKGFIFCTGHFFPWKNAQKCQIFSQNIYGKRAKSDPAVRKCF